MSWHAVKRSGLSSRRASELLFHGGSLAKRKLLKKVLCLCDARHTPLPASSLPRAQHRNRRETHHRACTTTRLPRQVGPHYRSIIHSRARDRSTPATDTDTGLSVRLSSTSSAALEGTKEGGVQIQQWQNHGGVPDAFRGNTRVLRFENGAPDSLCVRAPRTEIPRGATARMGTAARSGGGSHHRRCPRARGILGGLRRERW